MTKKYHEAKGEMSLEVLRVLFLELTPINDVRRLATGKDPETGEKANRWWAGGAVALEFVPIIGKLDNVAKVAKVAKSLDKVDDVADVAKVADKADDLADTAKTVDKVEDAKDVGKVADDVGDARKVFDINNPKTFNNANISDVEQYLDEALQGYQKAPLKRGKGVRYYDGHGNSWQLNKGYERASDTIHGGPYLKTTYKGKIVRISLER